MSPDIETSQNQAAPQPFGLMAAGEVDHPAVVDRGGVRLGREDEADATVVETAVQLEHLPPGIVLIFLEEMLDFGKHFTLVQTAA